MEEDILKFKRSEKLGEIIIAVFVIALFIIIQLPITPTPNKPIIYISAVLYMLFAFIWHKIKIPVAPANKNFVESVIGIIAISIVVRATGGSSSHFNFLYLLPNLAVSTTSTKWHAIGVWIVTVFCIAIEAFLFPAAQAISLGLINIWAVALVSFYGRSLSQECLRRGNCSICDTEMKPTERVFYRRATGELAGILCHAMCIKACSQSKLQQLLKDVPAILQDMESHV